jgi:hypothetical protein
VLAKLAIVEEEADEIIYWRELLIEAKIVPSKPSCRAFTRNRRDSRHDSGFN